MSWLADGGKHTGVLLKNVHLLVRLIRENHQPRIKDDLFDRVGKRPHLDKVGGDVPGIEYGTQ